MNAKLLAKLQALKGGKSLTPPELKEEQSVNPPDAVKNKALPPTPPKKLTKKPELVAALLRRDVHFFDTKPAPKWRVAALIEAWEASSIPPTTATTEEAPATTETPEDSPVVQRPKEGLGGYRLTLPWEASSIPPTTATTEEAPATTETPEDAPVVQRPKEGSGGYRLFIDCIPMGKGEVQRLDQILAPIQVQVSGLDWKRPKGLPTGLEMNWYAMLEYATGPGIIAGSLLEWLADNPLAGDIYVDSFLPSSKAVLEVLMKDAEYVVRSCR